MLGDAGCFGVTAFTKDPHNLLYVRAAAGFFTPLVPATAFVLERCSGPELVAAFGTQAAAALSGSVMADGVVAFLFPVVGWTGVNMVSAIAALVASTTLFCAVAANPKQTVAAEQQGHSGLCTGEVITSMLTALVLGWLLNILVVIRPEVLRERFGFGVQQLGMLSMATTIMQTIFSMKIVPAIGKSIGPRKMLTLGLVGGFVSAVGMSLTTKNVYAHISSYIGMMIAVLLGIIGNRSQLAPISQHTGVGSGTLSSLSRLFMTAGQALCPIVTFDLVETIEWWAPYAAVSTLIIVLWPLYLVAKINLWNEPAPAMN